MSNYPVIKAVLIAVIWITILIRGTLVMAQHTTDFFNVAQIAAACNFAAGPIAGQLVESYSGGDTTSLVAIGDGNGVAKGLPGRALIDCNSPTGTYAIITSPQFVPGSSTSDITSIVTTGITTLYRGGTIDPFDPNEPLNQMLSVVGDGKTESKSTPILLTDGGGFPDFGAPTWFLIGMEILLNRQGAPSGEFTFQSSLTLIPN
ncbi:hypothetical protein [Anabaenopsis arnoldii]|uniref:Dirigent protein n=1 Tax=Anabaenopsis arnoldii TaxID=2152938 RepID=A0ABT5ATL2_9CYAN|nr:hypothetical protein [Anabaenopsis arnoldii]MDB9540644.1 hypothetical protein [Anabaenopsis arnoldii]MDH6093082.1 hypothetical protein [Anabaenopsis arnoldii]